MTFYDDLGKVAVDVLKQFKQGNIDYIHVTPGNGPVDNPGEAVEVSYGLDAAVRGASFKYVQTGFAAASDLQITCSNIMYDSGGATLPFNPSENSFVSVDGIRHKIVKIVPKPAAGSVVAYTMIVRK